MAVAQGFMPATHQQPGRDQPRALREKYSRSWQLSMRG